MASQAPSPGTPRPRLLSAAQARLVLAVAALAALVLLASGWAAERGVRAREMAQLERDLEREALLVRELVAGEPFLPARTPALQEAALRASRACSLRVTLVAPDGTVLADSDVPLADLAGLESHAGRPEVAAALAGRVGHDARLSHSVGRRLLYLAVPAAEEPGAGAVRVAADLGAIDRETAALRRELAGAGLAALVFVLPLTLLLSHLALRPLRKIAEVVHSIAEGDLDRRLPRGAPGEFGRIAAAVNEMAEQLRARLRELTEDKERLQAVLAGMVEGVLVVDARAARGARQSPPARALRRSGAAPWGGPTGRWCAAPTSRRPSPRRRSRRSPSSGTSSTEGAEPRQPPAPRRALPGERSAARRGRGVPRRHRDPPPRAHAARLRGQRLPRAEDAADGDPRLRRDAARAASSPRPSATPTST